MTYIQVPGSLKISSAPTVASGRHIRFESSSNPGAANTATARVPHQTDRFGQRSASWQDEFSVIRCTWLETFPTGSLSVPELPLQLPFPRNIVSKLFEMSSTSILTGQDCAWLRQARPSRSFAERGVNPLLGTRSLQRRHGRQRKLFENTKPELTNEKAIQRNVVSSLALRVQPSLAKEPYPGPSRMDSCLITRICGPCHRYPEHEPPKRCEVTSRGMPCVHLVVHGGCCCRQSALCRDRRHVKACATGPATAG